MKHLRKSILTLLALTLFGGAGAWAQGPTQVTQVTTDLIASWQNVTSAVTLADMQALGFVAVDENTAAEWTGAPQGGYTLLVYGFNEGNGSLIYMLFYNGNVVQPGSGNYTKSESYNEIANTLTKWSYTGSPAIELTKEGDNQWSLGQTPDYDLELQVEYYEAHALKDIPAGWTVLVNGQDSTNSIVEGSLNITETDAVTLIPAGNPRRVKSVTLADETPQLQTVHVGGNVDATFYYLPGETWRQAIENHPTENAGFGIIGDDVRYNGTTIFIGYYGENLYPDTPVDPNADYQALLM